MSKLKLTQAEVDKLVVVERVAALPSLSGVGFNDTGMRVRISDVHVWQYVLWRNMLQRCFCEKYKSKRPTYRGVTCCEEWLSFGNFLEWCNKVVGYKGKPDGMSLDKDILLKGNKVYSPEGCCFVPAAVNSLLTDSRSARGDCPQGVSYHKIGCKFTAQLYYDGRLNHLGYYNTTEDAFAAYKIAKEAQIKIVATQYKDVLSPAAYKSLMGWEINIGD